jgi:hypothetical protein
MLSTRECLTFLPTNTTSRKWLATPLHHDATLTKSRFDVSRPTDAFRNIVDAKLLNRASLHRLFLTNHTSHFVLLKMLLFIAYFAWERVMKCVSPPTISKSGVIYVSVPDALSVEKKIESLFLSLISFRFLTLEKTGMLPS